MKLLLVVVCFYTVVQLTNATRTRKCGTSDPVAENDKAKMPVCDKLPCKLRKKSEVELELKFTPSKNVNKVVNSVHAILLGVPFPFIGVDGNAVCDKIYDTSGGKVDCPLSANKEYVYKDSFKVLEVYPKLKAWVHWALNDEKGEQLFCMEVPIKITS